MTKTRKTAKWTMLERPQHPQTPKLCGKRCISITFLTTKKHIFFTKIIFSQYFWDFLTLQGKDFAIWPDPGCVRHCKARPAQGCVTEGNFFLAGDLAAGCSLPERYRWQKWTFQRKYNNFEKKNSKIDKKFASQSILEVGHFMFKKKVFFQNLDFFPQEIL